MRPTLAEHIQGMEPIPGFMSLYWDDAGGRLLMEISRFDEPFLYVRGLSAGAGSNDLGLDRGRMNAPQLVRFKRSGRKVLLVEENVSYRAISDNADERRAVEDSFAQSVLWGFEVEAAEKDRVLVDATEFALADANQVAGWLAQAKQGSFRIDKSRSAVVKAKTKSFERNTEIEAWLTFTTAKPGRHVQSVTPTPTTMTLRQRQSFVALPEPGYRPRTFDSRSGSFGQSFFDYATPFHAPLVRRFVVRHRLEKADPKAKVSPAVEPIVYYVDRGAPEPIRSALVEGASWWAQAFKAAGFKDGFRVELLPEGADPLDVRYNVIQWVHRKTRGWSYGASLTDPRTGEIIKGHVTLGSLRVRQDLRIAEALLAPYQKGKDAKVAREMALARLRQLAAHEVGHTLGLAHNFAASTNDRASVMDYPHPLVTTGEDGQIDVSKAYDTGVGAWDVWSIRFAYTPFSPKSEKAGLAALLREPAEAGLHFLDDGGARSEGGAHPLGHLWDNGADPVAELQNVLAVRKQALSRFGEESLPIGRPMSDLAETLVPLYLFHRYQVEAVVKLVGGVDYAYTVRGGAPHPVAPVDEARQAAAWTALFETLTPEVLELPPSILSMVSPAREYGGPLMDDRERFKGRTGPTLDPMAMVEAAAGHTVRLLLHPARAERLAQSGQLLPMLKQLLTKTVLAPDTSRLRRTVDNVILNQLLQLVVDARTSQMVRGQVHEVLVDVRTRLGSPVRVDDEVLAHRRFGVWRIERYLQYPERLSAPPPVSLPPGSPIGCGHEWGG